MKPIISREDWELAQEKRSKIITGVRKFMIGNMHIFCRNIKMSLLLTERNVANIAKAEEKDNKTRYYYYCKNTVNAQMKLKPLWFGLFLILIETWEQ